MTTAALESTMFKGAGVDIAADTGGPADGVPVVLLHGGGQTRFSWGAATRHLAAGGYRAISIDLRGHGESGWAEDGNYRLDAFVDDLAAIVSTLGRPAFLVGASLGGLASLVTAGEKRAPVAGLVLVDVAPRIEMEGAERIGAFMRAQPEGFASLEEAADSVSAYMPHRPRPKDTSGLLKNLRLKDDGRYHWHWDPRFIGREISSSEFTQNGIRLENAARALTVPTLLVRGALSAVVSEESVAQFRELVPHGEVVNIAGADHMVAGDRNDMFNEAVIDFLNRQTL
ncbi:non-heme chloroperoxidase [Sphingobium wenxiniae]|uniref:Pimeloyl-ACP methyl ester carboxylesterase n=1 Tax=Sphingobium wenxiniae (strain DSM 21828 / CGMCC 1.7748 / JZ-1) TaxID=595605 RepID=A0A562KIQ5_SPHWJ|nr:MULTISPECIES: alpha/beta hydrolase [Sphingobium]MBB6190448.1 non-heme chloroperoxidase [Sphingobium wenxiniae]TWH95165.1 pimeloyl-ACP methyl ester carboxylesterase [Sphingobium wenxiniae]WRD78160.1 alpha/beta hydrolase [Sphingobium baderi]